MNDEAADRGGIDRVRVAAYAVVRDPDERVLLCHIHPSVGVGDVWTLPGGGLEFGESPAHAAVRELEEETGFVGEIERLVEVDDRVFSNGDGADRMHAIRIVYEVRIWRASFATRRTARPTPVAGSRRTRHDGCAWGSWRVAR